MSEKRFVVFDEDEVKDTKDLQKESVWCQNSQEAERCCEWLNALNDENEQLRKHIRALQESETSSLENSVQWSEQVKKLEDENEQLRKTAEYWQKKYEQGTETFQIGEK